MRNSKGFTLAELVVVVALMGVLVSFALPTYQSTVMETQHQINQTNMIIIKQTFFIFSNPLFYKSGLLESTSFSTTFNLILPSSLFILISFESSLLLLLPISSSSSSSLRNNVSILI